MRILTMVLLLSLIALVGCSDDEETSNDSEVVETELADEDSDTPHGQIAFESYRDGEMEIFVMDADGSNLTQLTATGGRFPVWSPDGNYIAFESYVSRELEIFVMNADGGNLTQLTRGGARFPVWSPDGGRIVFESSLTGRNEIFVMDVDESNLTQLTVNGGYTPAWISDGSHIVYRSYLTGASEIFVMNADGSNQTQLTSNGGSEDYSLSPDGSRIAFCSDRNGHEEIFVIDADGRNQTQLTFDYYGNGGYWGSSSLAWSPDGNQISFISRRDMGSTSDGYDNYHMGHDEPFVMDADGSNLTQLSTTTGWASSGWSPDGKYLVFTEGSIDEGWTIFIRDADGGNVTQLTTEDSSSPAWCPITTSPTTPAPPVHLLVVVDSLRLRDEPNTDSGEQVGLLEKGDTVEVLWRWESWAKVRTESDLDAWACVELDGETFLAPAE